jgi:hypothetical protein
MYLKYIWIYRYILYDLLTVQVVLRVAIIVAAQLHKKTFYWLLRKIW